MQPIAYVVVEQPDPPSVRRLNLLRKASACACVAFFFLSLASTLPFWVVSGLHGEANVAGVSTLTTDVGVGSGIFVKNYCFGPNRPSEEFMQQFGLTCAGVSQVDDAESVDDCEKEGDSECVKFKVAQAFSSMTMFCLVASVLFGGSCALNSGAFALASTLSAFSALFSSLIVLATMLSTSMMDRDKFFCERVLGGTLELCYAPGPCVLLQLLGIVAASTSCGVLAYAFVGGLFGREHDVRNVSIVEPLVVGQEYRDDEPV